MPICPHLGGGTPSGRWGGGTRSFLTGGYPHPSQWGYPILLMGGTPIWPMWYPWVPPVRTGWGTGYPQSGLSRWGNPPHQDWIGVTPPSHNQKTEQQIKHLLRGRRYASCVHTGGLSSLKEIILIFLFL